MGPVQQVLERFVGGARKRPVYMLDFSCFDHPQSWLRTVDEMVEHARAFGLPEEAIAIQKAIVESGALGVGNRSAFSPGVLMVPPQNSIAASRIESEAVLFSVAENAMKEAGISPEEVDYVVTTCTVFVPVPSLSAMVMHHFQMRSDCQNYSLAGHGCSGGVLLLALAQDLLRANCNKVVLLLAHENITAASYFGTDAEFMATNMLFRSGGAAAVLSNRSKDRARAKYQLLHTVRVNTSADDAAYRSIQSVDTDLHSPSVHLNLPVIKVAAAKAIALNLRKLGPSLLPVSELLKAVRNKDPNFVPDFSKAVQHVAIHPGARFVIEKVRKTLNFGERAAHPSHATLYRFGNTSASSTYYILANLESRVGIKKGDKVLQLSMGSGFKSCSAVWKALRPINTKHPCWAFRDYQPELDAAMLMRGQPKGGLEKKSIDVTNLARAVPEQKTAIDRMKNPREEEASADLPEKAVAVNKLLTLETRLFNKGSAAK